MASGRYAALLEPSKPPSPPAGSSPAPQPEESRIVRDDQKPANPQVRKPTNPQTRNEPDRTPKVDPHGFSTAIQGEVVEKYTTRLKPSMVKKVKVFAAERDIKDYEVVENALLEFFARHTK